MANMMEGLSLGFAGTASRLLLRIEFVESIDLPLAMCAAVLRDAQIYLSSGELEAALTLPKSGISPLQLLMAPIQLRLPVVQVRRANRLIARVVCTGNARHAPDEACENQESNSLPRAKLHHVEISLSGI